MAENTKIEWAHHTGGPYLGCTEVSPGCAHCYARELMLRRLYLILRKAYKRAGMADWETLPVWGDKAPRVLTRGFWRDARRLNRKAAAEGVRYRMFPSMIDWLDTMPAGIVDQDGTWLDPRAVLAEFLGVISHCRHLYWLLLTKRPELWRQRLESILNLPIAEGPIGVLQASGIALAAAWLNGAEPANVWIGTTVEDQARADQRIPHLLDIPARVRFLSCEPLLGPVKLPEVALHRWISDGTTTAEYLGPRIHWVISGGESGPGARPMYSDWARSLRDQCAAAGVAFFMKQMGGVRKPFPEIPADLLVRQFPEELER